MLIRPNDYSHQVWLLSGSLTAAIALVVVSAEETVTIGVGFVLPSALLQSVLEPLGEN